MNNNNAMSQHIEKLIEIAEKCKQVYDSGYISGAEEIFLRLSDAFLAAANAYTDEKTKLIPVDRGGTGATTIPGAINKLAGFTKGIPSSVQIVYGDIVDTGAMPIDEDGNPKSCTTREFIKNMNRGTANIEFPHSRYDFSPEGEKKPAVNLTDIPTDFGYVTLAWDTLYRVRGMCYDANTSDVWVYTYRIDWEKNEEKSIDENIWYHYGWKKLVGYNGGDICAPTLDFVSPNNSCGGFLQRVFTHPDEPHNCGMIFGTSADVKNKGSSECSGIKFMHAQRDKAGSVRPIGSRASFFFTCDDLYEVELDTTTGEYKETGTKIKTPDTGYNFTKVNKDKNPKTDTGKEVFLVTYNTDKKIIKKYYCAHEANSPRWFEIWGAHNILFDALTGSKEACAGEIEDENILLRYRGRAMKRDSNGRSSVMGPTLPKHVANKEYVDKQNSDKLSEAKKYTDDKIDDLIDGAPGALDTLKEISDALAVDDNAVAALVNTVAENKTAAEAYADSKASTAEKNAKAYADSKASTAEKNAKDYADAKVIDGFKLIENIEMPQSTSGLAYYKCRLPKTNDFGLFGIFITDDSGSKCFSPSFIYVANINTKFYFNADLHDEEGELRNLIIRVEFIINATAPTDVEVNIRKELDSGNIVGLANIPANKFHVRLYKLLNF